MLNKEFKRKDVERMRNLIKGKSGESSELQVGYTKSQEQHKEGDIWEEKGKKWIIKDGIKQTYTKLDEVKKAAILPLFCPNCKSLMKKRNDTKMYNIHKMCFDCVIDMEGKLKIEGKYNEYERNTIAITQSKDILCILYILVSLRFFIKDLQLGQNKGKIAAFFTSSSLV
jgi:hypothetical protein